MPDHVNPILKGGLTRRDLLRAAAVGVVLGTGVSFVPKRYFRMPQQAQSFVGRADHYQVEIADIIARGIRELGVPHDDLKGKRILLKPNLVETASVAPHINTHPLVLRGAVEAFLRLGAASVMVAEGPGHRRDTLAVYEESGLADVLTEDHIPFRDLNYITGSPVQNLGRQSQLRTLTFPSLFKEVDWIVSVAKMKTHHWAGVTLSLKNMFGCIPGAIYGWPKNVLHWAGIHESIVDINSTLPVPRFAIVDGIVGMEGNGPIQGDPRPCGALVFGDDPVAVDATAARLMTIDPRKIRYLTEAGRFLGHIAEERIDQAGEPIDRLRQDFRVLPAFHAIKSFA